MSELAIEQFELKLDEHSCAEVTWLGDPIETMSREDLLKALRFFAVENKLLRIKLDTQRRDC